MADLCRNNGKLLLHDRKMSVTNAARSVAESQAAVAKFSGAVAIGNTGIQKNEFVRR